MIQRKRRGFQGGSGAKVPGGDRSEPTEPAGETAPPIVLGGQPGALLALLKAGNCHNPYPDTVENGTTLRKSGIHDTQFDAKAPTPTPKNRKIDALQNSRSGRLCRPL